MRGKGGGAEGGKAPGKQESETGREGEDPEFKCLGSRDENCRISRAGETQVFGLLRRKCVSSGVVCPV